jgi:hypothetical protein
VHWEKYPEPLFPSEQNRTSPIMVPDGERCFRLYNMHPEVRVSFSRACNGVRSVASRSSGAERALLRAGGPAGSTPYAPGGR